MSPSTLEVFDHIREDHERRRLLAPRAVGLLDRIHEAKADAVDEKLNDLESMRIAVAGFVTFGQDMTEEGERSFSARLDKITGDSFVNTPTTGYAVPKEDEPLTEAEMARVRLIASEIEG